MKLKAILVIIAAMFLAESAFAQHLPKKVSNVTVLDLDGEPITLPNWGKKNLLIFYVDPDHPRQNHEFTVEMEENKRCESPHVYGFGIINLKDAPLVPNGLARKLAKNRTIKNKATILSDQGRILSEAWGLGDCNNKFVLMIVSKQGELVYIHKGEFKSEAEKEEFYRALEPYK